VVASALQFIVPLVVFFSRRRRFKVWSPDSGKIKIEEASCLLCVSTNSV
jgi:hypothetical protein